MALYEYRCPDCGSFEVRAPIGTATRTAPCPGCAVPARRVFTSPLTARTPAPLARMLGREEASRERPEVVTSIPASARPAPSPASPAWGRLPRP